jgi:polyphosphate kinase
MCSDGAAGVKTHAKAALVVRQEKDRLVRYVHLSTGNNAGTAKIYTDTGFFTANPDFGEDASELFNSLSGFSKKSSYRSSSRRRRSSKESSRRSMARPRGRARASARIFAKLNSLVDARRHPERSTARPGRSLRRPEHPRHLPPPPGRARRVGEHPVFSVVGRFRP